MRSKDFLSQWVATKVSLNSNSFVLTNQRFALFFMKNHTMLNPIDSVKDIKHSTAELYNHIYIYIHTYIYIYVCA